MLTDVTININPEDLTRVAIAVSIFVIGLLVLLGSFLVVKKQQKNQPVEVKVDINDRINRLYFLYQNKEITEQELEHALAALYKKEVNNEKNS